MSFYHCPHHSSNFCPGFGLRHSTKNLWTAGPSKRSSLPATTADARSLRMSALPSASLPFGRVSMHGEMFPENIKKI
uniref:Uncharacterized protein n=1 Tax=Meloidogyne incognita TaxID=6306 RepID=A0A914L8I3_MELIC